MPEAEFQGVAWVLKGITGSDAAGLLRLNGGRLNLIGQNGLAFGDIRKGRSAGKEWKRLLW